MTQQTQGPEEQVLSLPDFSAIAPEEAAAPLPPHRPWWRRRGGIISLILVVLLILAAFLAFFLVRGRQRPIIYEKQQVTQGNFSLTVSATGPVQGSLYNLVFTGSGTIAELDVSVGQTVVKGQVLAKLNKTSLQDALNAAQATVLSAQTGVNSADANLSKAEAQSNASVQAAQTTLTNAQKSLTTTQTQSAASITVSQTTLSNDQTTLTNTQAQSSASVAAAQTALSNAQTTLSHAQALAAAQIAQACNPPTGAPGQACNTATAQADANVAAAQNGVSTAQQALATAQAQANLNNATTQNGVSTAQKGLSSAQATATSNNAIAQAKVSSDQVNLTLTIAQASSNNTTAQNAFNAASSALATAQTSASSSVTTLQGTANAAQSTLQSALVGLQTAQHNLANATLLAPHAGIVTTINGTVGGTPGVPTSSTATSTTGGGVGTGGGTFIQIADISTLQVVASVNESDTANLNIGEPAQFTVSAYGNRIFTGTVSAISPLGQTVSNVVTFPVTIDVDMSSLHNATLLPGMTASVTIVVIQQPNVTLIPVNAINFARTATGTVNGIPPLITTDQATSALAQARQMLRQLLIQDPSIQQQNPVPAYVIEQPTGQTSFIAVPVVLGLTDDTYYVVLQGVSPGDIIVVGAVRG